MMSEGCQGGRDWDNGGGGVHAVNMDLLSTARCERLI